MINFVSILFGRYLSYAKFSSEYELAKLKPSSLIVKFLPGLVLMKKILEIGLNEWPFLA